MQPILVALVLMGTALALPAAEQGVIIDDCCCCCDISKGAISCTEGIPQSQCFCAAVVCPANAPTIFPGVAPRPTVFPGVPPQPNPAPIAFPPPPPAPWWWDLLTGANSGAPKSDCCCCNPSLGAISCQKQSGICICPAVACPANAPTIWPNGDGPVRTPIPIVPITPQTTRPAILPIISPLIAPLPLLSLFPRDVPEQAT